MPTGGVDTSKDNLKQWFDAGVTCVGMGSALFPKDIMANKDWDALTQKVKELMANIEEVR